MCKVNQLQTITKQKKTKFDLPLSDMYITKQKKMKIWNCTGLKLVIF
jgi:hypothetical protein